MEKSATELMQDSIVAAVLEAIVAWKAASGGLANALARDLGAVHPNTTFADLPKEVQVAITASVRSAFNRLLKEGYTVAKGQPQRPPSLGPRPDGPRPDSPRPDGPRPDGPRPQRPGSSRPPRPGADARRPIVEHRPKPRGGGGGGGGKGGGGKGGGAGGGSGGSGAGG